MVDDYPDFAVDIPNRRVTHTSGAAASFYEYLTDEDWLSSGPHLHNEILYPGPSWEFARLAKEAAIRAGMKRSKS